jgi:dTDP-D-glucose 4,6-dehydratase
MRTLDDSSIESKFDYCFIGSGVILNRLLLEVPIKGSRCLIISDQLKDASFSLVGNSVTVITRLVAMNSAAEFKIGTLVILAKTHLWHQPEEFEELILRLNSKVDNKVIHVSSGSVYGEATTNVDESSPLNPLTAYGVRKVNEEKCVVNTFSGVVSVQILRVSNVFGDSLFHDFTNQCIKAAVDKSSVKIYSNGSIIRDFVFVKCLVDALLQLIMAEPREENMLLNLSTGIGTSIRELMDLISERTGLDIKMHNYSRPNDVVQRSVLDNSLILRTIPWRPIDVETGMKLYLNEVLPDLISDV